MLYCTSSKLSIRHLFCIRAQSELQFLLWLLLKHPVHGGLHPHTGHATCVPRALTTYLLFSIPEFLLTMSLWYQGYLKPWELLFEEVGLSLTKGAETGGLCSSSCLQMGYSESCLIKSLQVWTWAQVTHNVGQLDKRSLCCLNSFHFFSSSQVSS